MLLRGLTQQLISFFLFRSINVYQTANEDEHRENVLKILSELCQSWVKSYLEKNVKIAKPSDISRASAQKRAKRTLMRCSTRSEAIGCKSTLLMQTSMCICFH